MTDERGNCRGPGNDCDLRCPKKTMMAVRYRHDLAGASPAHKLLTSTVLGIRGVGQAARASATCKSRHLSGEAWVPSDACLAEAQEIADGMPRLTRSSLTESEVRVLSMIRFKDDPPAERED